MHVLLRTFIFDIIYIIIILDLMWAADLRAAFKFKKQLILSVDCSVSFFIIYKVVKYRNILMKYIVYFIFSLVKI